VQAYDGAVAAFNEGFKEEGCADDAQLLDKYQARAGLVVGGGERRGYACVCCGAVREHQLC